MTLLQMNYLVEIYRCGSMNKAAQNLFVSQSAVSAAIRELEEELGIRIFHRSNRGIALTEDGRELLAQVAPLVERSRKIQNYYSERRVENRARLAISTQRYPFCAKAFVEFLHLLDEPRIEVSLKETDMSSVIEEVAGQQSDLGVLFVTDMTESFIRRILDGRNLEFFGLVRIRPHVFLRRGHPLAQCAAVTPEQLRAYPSVVFTQRESNLNYAEEAVVGSGAERPRHGLQRHRPHGLRVHRQRRAARRLRRRAAAVHPPVRASGGHAAGLCEAAGHPPDGAGGAVRGYSQKNHGGDRGEPLTDLL